MKAILALLSLVLASGAQAQSLKEKYELSERCAKQAAETFAKDWEGQSPSQRANYENRYNSRLNKCFYMEVTYHERGKEPLRAMRLYDLNENREIAGYHEWGNALVYCWVQEKKCRNEEEWRALIKPFMED
jgi:hypothetical protein